MTPHRKKCPHVVHFNVPRDWFESNSRHQKCYSEGGKKICGCRGLLGRVISHKQEMEDLKLQMKFLEAAKEDLHTKQLYAEACSHRI